MVDVSVVFVLCCIFLICFCDGFRLVFFLLPTDFLSYQQEASRIFWGLETHGPSLLKNLCFECYDTFWTFSHQIENVIVDLSHWDQSVDFKLAKEDGILGIIHKATQGLKYSDPTYANRRKAAEEQGLMWGAYHFGVGDNGKDQAEHFLETVGDHSKILLALDVEKNQDGENITPKQAEDFVDKVHEVTGRLPLIYGSPSFLKDFATPILTKCPLWVAKWSANPIPPGGWEKWVIWQYTDGKSGEEPHSVKGIGPCDRDKFNGTLEELKDFWNA